MIDPETVKANLVALRSRIEATGRDPDTVTIMAVTKGFGSDAVVAAVAAGLTDLGENYAQELLAKHDAAPGARWHFIGRLQSNKIAQLAGNIDDWHSLDRLKLIRLVARHAPGAEVHIQVNISGETNKGGCNPDQAAELVDAAHNAGLEVAGLMGVASLDGAAATEFELLKRLADSSGLESCSMGMSGDLEAALGAGSTMIRVGTGLFGPRPIRDRGT